MGACATICKPAVCCYELYQSNKVNCSLAAAASLISIALIVIGALAHLEIGSFGAIGQIGSIAMMAGATTLILLVALNICIKPTQR